MWAVEYVALDVYRNSRDLPFAFLQPRKTSLAIRWARWRYMCEERERGCDKSSIYLYLVCQIEGHFRPFTRPLWVESLREIRSVPNSLSAALEIGSQFYPFWRAHADQVARRSERFHASMTRRSIPKPGDHVRQKVENTSTSPVVCRKSSRENTNFRIAAQRNERNDNNLLVMGPI